MSKNITLPHIFPVACHTDHIGPGSIFVAIQGMKDDGIHYIHQAIQKGAKKIVVSENAIIDQNLMQQLIDQNIEVILVENPRKALAQLSAQVLDFPARKLKIIGITGTKGKTTTSFLVEHLLKSAGYKTALLSTAHNKIDDVIFKTNLTTQHPDYVHVFFDQCVKNNIEYVVMEVAAQALTLERVFGLQFEGVIFTNFDQEHGEFYATLDEYFAAKCQLLNQVKTTSPIIINFDNQWCKKIVNQGKNLFTFSLKDKKVDYRGTIIKNDILGLNIAINGANFSCPSLFGEFNAYNILAAVSLLKKLNISSANIAHGLLTFAGVPGRLQMVDLKNGAKACIDKAHNPSSFVAILSTLRSLTNHLIVVFGCGGERDKTKRPLMGNIAATFGDLVILTSDNPRSENPAAIIDDIFVGVENPKKIIKEIDRQKAINIAYKYSTPMSIIALLGKGPDEYQLVNNERQYFSEVKILQHL